MNADTEKKAPAKATGRRHASVSDLMKEECISPEVQEKFAELERATRVTEELANLRQNAGLTQEKMAEKLGVTQSAISKLEAGRDEDLTLAVIGEYSKATGQRVSLVFGKPLNHVESVKAYALGVRIV